jgi:outer membrane protein TolC
LASRQVEKKMLEYQQDRDDQLKKLAETFYDWSAAWQDRQISDNKRDLLRKQFNVLEAQYKQGLKTKRDVLRIETEVRRLQIDLLHKDNDLEVKLQTLSALAGISREQLRTSGVNAEEAKIDAPIASGPWPELKVEDHRRFRIYKKASEVSEMESRLVERDYWPQISLAGEVQNKYSDYADTGKRFDTYEYWQWQALLTIKYNLWDWGERSRNLQIARIKERTVQSTNEQSLLDLDVELRDVWLRLKEYSETVRLTKDLLVIEQQSLDIMRTEYSNGRVTYLDLITNLNSWVDARSKFATSYFSLKKQQATYAFHKGTLYDYLKQK